MQRRWEDLTGKLSCTFLTSRMLFEEVFQLKDVMVKTYDNVLLAMVRFSCFWEQNWVETANSASTTVSVTINAPSMMSWDFEPCPRCR